MKKQTFLKAIHLVLLLFLSTYLLADNIKILTWNIRDLGRSKDDTEIYNIAKIVRDYDIVAIQEVVAKDPAGVQAVARIADELNRMGNKWDYRVSDPTRSPSSHISERYAFIWKTSKVTLLGRPFLDEALAAYCFREPYIAKFKPKKGNTSFYVVNYHSRKHNDHPEQEIVYFEQYPERLETNNVFIVGDFNLNEQHKVWQPLYQKGFAASLHNSPTTLKMKCANGKYLNHPIDNIFYHKATTQVINAGKIDFVQNCSTVKAARYISDHLPVFLEVEMN